jgi:hypothetical protein
MNYYARRQNATHSLKITVLRIRDPVPFWPLDPGSGMGRGQHPDPGSGMNNLDHIFESLETIFLGLNT